MDRNDHSPVISSPSPDNPSVDIKPNLAPGSEIAKVMAYDMDSGPNGQLSYSINKGNSSAGMFIIDSVSGVISLGNQVLPPDVKAYNVVISVRDNGMPQRLVFEIEYRCFLFCYLIQFKGFGACQSV